jgi:hypothetical protein
MDLRRIAWRRKEFFPWLVSCRTVHPPCGGYNFRNPAWHPAAMACAYSLLCASGGGFAGAARRHLHLNAI